MKITKKAINIGLALSFVVSGAFAQSIKDAKVAINAEQYDKAKTMLKGLIEKQGAKAKGDNYFYLGQIYLKTDNPDSAKIIFQNGVQADAKYDLNKIGLGEVALLEGDAATASRLFSEATAKLKKKDYEEYLYIGQGYINAKEPDYAKAIQNLEEAKTRNSTDPQVHLALGDAYLANGDNSHAYIAFNEARNLDPSLLIANVQLAVIQKKAYAEDLAVSDLVKITEEHPDFAPAYRELAETYYQWSTRSTTLQDQAEKRKMAVQYYKKYMDLTDYSIDSRMRYADFLILAKDYKTLQEQAREMANDAGMNKRILRYLGYAAYENGNLEESQKALKEFIASVAPERVIAQDYLFLGMTEIDLATDTVNNTINQALFTTGVSDLKKAIEKDSLIAEDLNDVGMKFFNGKQYEAAAQIFELGSSVESSKNSVYDNFYLGYALYFAYVTHLNDEIKPDKDLLRRSAAAFKRVGELAPTTETAFLYEAKAEYMLEDPENPKGLMVAPYEKFIEVVNEKGGATVTNNKRYLIEAHSVLGAYYANLGNKEGNGVNNYEKARAHFEDVLLLDPNDEYALHALENLEPAK
jgi:tetratricopeptide (TPR) repeat protein